MAVTACLNAERTLSPLPAGDVGDPLWPAAFGGLSVPLAPAGVRCSDLEPLEPLNLGTGRWRRWSK